MADFTMKREVRHGSVRYHLEGVFDGQAAFELKRTLRDEIGCVQLDFSKVRQFFDFGLAAIATELQSPECARIEVELRGLGTHHRRLLQYFGLDLERDHEPHFSDALEPAAIVRTATV